MSELNSLTENINIRALGGAVYAAQMAHPRLRAVARNTLCYVEGVISRLVANKASVIASGVSLLTVASATRTVPSEQCSALLCASIAHKFKSRRLNSLTKNINIQALYGAVYAAKMAHPRLRAVARNTSFFICSLCPLRSMSANAARLRLSSLVVTEVSAPCTQKK